MVHPVVFAEHGYKVPTTLDEFYALTEPDDRRRQHAAVRRHRVRAATGWPFTDWVEELVLRNQGIDYYNQWVTHEVPFNSPAIVEAMQTVADLWNTEGAVYAAGGDTSTPFRDNTRRWSTATA